MNFGKPQLTIVRIAFGYPVEQNLLGGFINCRHLKTATFFGSTKKGGFLNWSKAAILLLNIHDCIASKFVN
jgi:hypothetical protein